MCTQVDYSDQMDNFCSPVSSSSPGVQDDTHLSTSKCCNELESQANFISTSSKTSTCLLTEKPSLRKRAIDGLFEAPTRTTRDAGLTGRRGEKGAGTGKLDDEKVV